MDAGIVEGIERLQYQEKRQGFSAQLKEEVIEEAWGRQIGHDRSPPLPSRHLGGMEHKQEAAASKRRGAFTDTMELCHGRLSVLATASKCGRKKS